MKLENVARVQRESRKGKRFYTAVDMAIIKHDAAILNAKEKRGELTRHANRFVYRCGCGVEGCFIHTSRENR